MHRYTAEVRGDRSIPLGTMKRYCKRWKISDSL